MRIASLLLVVVCSSAAADLKDLSFLTGCWEGEGVEEVWMKPAGGTMLGMGRTVKGDRTVFTEFFHVSAEPNGSVVLNVQLKLAGKSTQFRLNDVKNGTATFSNPEHDYPQRIIYRREPDGSLFARIEGTTGGKERHDDFKYRAAPCSR